MASKNNLSCDYHPNVNAVDRCERCHRNICLNDKRIFRRRRSSGTGSHHRSYTEKYTYCIPCNTDAVVNANTGPMAILVNIFFIVFGLVFAGVAGPLGFFGLFFSGIGVYRLVTGPGKADKARKEEEQFLQNLQTGTKGVSQTRSYKRYEAYTPTKTKSMVELTCFQCGDRIPMDARYCMNCGDPAKEEKKAHQEKY